MALLDGLKFGVSTEIFKGGITVYLPRGWLILVKLLKVQLPQRLRGLRVIILQEVYRLFTLLLDVLLGLVDKKFLKLHI